MRLLVAYQRRSEKEFASPGKKYHTEGPDSLSMKKSVCLLPLFAVCIAAQTPVGNPTGTVFKDQDYQKPENCLPCHQRQFDELRSSVKSGYRNVSPLFNGLESSANFINGGLLRPTYPDSPIVLPDGVPLNSNMFTTSPLTEIRQVQSGFCFTCHNAEVERLGDNPATREVPQLSGVQAAFRPGSVPASARLCAGRRQRKAGVAGSDRRSASVGGSAFAGCGWHYLRRLPQHRRSGPESQFPA